jgi:hypothetical protein
MSEHLLPAPLLSRIDSVGESLNERLKLNTQQLCGSGFAVWGRGGCTSVGDEVRDASQVVRPSSPGACRRSNHLLRVRVACDALREATVQACLHRDDINRILTVRRQIDHLRILVDQEIVPLCVPKTLYEASRVKRFFAINISSLPTFQEAQFCIDGTADSPAWSR